MSSDLLTQQWLRKKESIFFFVLSLALLYHTIENDSWRNIIYGVWRVLNADPNSFYNCMDHFNIIIIFFYQMIIDWILRNDEHEPNSNAWCLFQTKDLRFEFFAHSNGKSQWPLATNCSSMNQVILFSNLHLIVIRSINTQKKRWYFWDLCDWSKQNWFIILKFNGIKWKIRINFENYKIMRNIFQTNMSVFFTFAFWNFATKTWASLIMNFIQKVFFFSF